MANFEDIEKKLNDDYKKIPELDKYDQDQFDDKKYEKVTFEERKKAEKYLDKEKEGK